MPGERVLVVDDNAQNLKLAKLVLDSLGYDAATASDAEDAQRMLDAFDPRLILMDLQLPGMDGLELTRRLKADSVRRHIVIVALTAYAMKGDRERAHAAGCDDYIPKPIDADLLARTLKELLARSR